MYLPSITVIIGAIFMGYVSYSVYTLSQLFSSLQCTSTPCYTTILARLPKLQLNLFVSTINNPLTKDVTKIGAIEDFDYYKELTRYVFRWKNWLYSLLETIFIILSWKYIRPLFDLNSEFSIDIPRKTYRNGTMFLHLVLVNDIGVEFEWRNLKREGLTVMQRIQLTEYMVPRPATFNLLNDNEVRKFHHVSWNDVTWPILLLCILMCFFDIIFASLARSNSSKEKEASVTLEAESVRDHFNWSFFGVKWRYSSRNGSFITVNYIVFNITLGYFLNMDFSYWFFFSKESPKTEMFFR